MGPATALSPKERNTLIDLAKIRKNDVFCDLGSGHGRLVVDVIRKTKAKRAVGIEVNYNRFCNAVRYAKRSLSKKQLKRIDFYCTDYDKTDFSDATVIYEGHERSRHEVENFDDVLGYKKARIITRDLPLIRCKPFRIASYRTTTLFLMRTPLHKDKAKAKDKWATWVLQRNATISDVHSYHDLLLKQRGFTKRERMKARRELRDAVNACFPTARAK